ncbi:MAG: helix-turn-helix domain-containing protein [Chloroflexi bacterium]|nr:helix-turn-helix domain-containing protein [Chloroflexota bacterium]
MNPEKVAFGRKLKEILKVKEISQMTLALDLLYSKSSVSNWVTGRSEPSLKEIQRICQYLDISADILLDIKSSNNFEYTHNKIKWLEYIPPSTNSYNQEIATGIALFRAIYVDGVDLGDLLKTPQFSGYDLRSLPLTFITAVRSGFFRLLEVPRNKKLERMLINEFDLTEAIVADLPDNSDETVVRAEFVAFLAATDALEIVKGRDAIGIGAGYTLRRFVELSSASRDQFRGTKWIPLLASQADNYGPLSANLNALLLAGRHPNSEALYFPFTHKDRVASEQETFQYNRVMQALRSTNALFVTVNGYDRKFSSHTQRLPLEQFRSVDHYSLGNLSGLYAKIVDLGLARELSGEFLGLLLDRRGRPLPQILNESKKAFSQIDLEYIQQLAQSSLIWVVASGNYKVEPTLMMLENKLANAVVIDSGIANQLLESRA